MTSKALRDRWCPVGATLALAAAMLVTGGTQVAAADPAPVVQPAAAVTADRLPTVQVDGVVWSQAVVGNTVYAGGSFNNARPAGAAAGHQPHDAAQPARLRHHDGQPRDVVRPGPQRAGAGRSPPRPTARASTSSATSPPPTGRPGGGSRPTAPPPGRSSPRSTRPVPARRPVPSSPRTTPSTSAAASPAWATAPCATTWRPSGPPTAPSCPGTRTPDYTVWAHRRVSGDGASVFAGGSFRNVGGQAAYGLAKINGASGALDTTLAAVGPQRRRRTPASAACACRAASSTGRPGTSARAATSRAPSRSRSTADSPTWSGSPTATATTTPAS